MIKILTYPLLFLSLIVISCSSKDTVYLDITNDSNNDVIDKIVELPVSTLSSQLGCDVNSFIVLDKEGKELVSQLTSDSLLIFQVSIKSGKNETFKIMSSDCIKEYESLVNGRIIPERADDVAWENELVGFRAYGPATQNKGEQVFGYDIFFKYPQNGLVLEELYAPEIDPATWIKVDSLRAVSPQLADDFIESFSYHIDHGKGMDCFPVGPTLGAGVAAPIVGDSISFPWCYKTAEILDNGPLRFTVKLDFEPRTVGKNQNVIEHRIISLDACSLFNKTKVWYENQTMPFMIATGFPLRDDSPLFREPNAFNIIAYSHPVQREEYGRALLGIAVPDSYGKIVTSQNHLLVIRELEPGQLHEYIWGFIWQNAPEMNIESWVSVIESEVNSNQQILKININTI